MNLSRFLSIFLLLAAAVSVLPAQSGMRARAQSTDRKMARLLFFAMKDGQFAGIPGQFTISYGAPTWKASYADQMKKFEGTHTRWRFGKDAWTTLDTNLEFDLGGQKVPAGYYYLVLEHTKENKMNLVLLDPKVIMAKHFDAFQADKTEGGIIVPLKHESGKKAREEFTIAFQADDSDTKKSTLSIAWGPHLLSAPVTAHVK